MQSANRERAAPILTRDGLRALRGASWETTRKDDMAEQRQWSRRMRKMWRDMWLAEHPGRTAKEFSRLYNSDEFEKWRRAKMEAITAAERQAWEAEHQGQEWLAGHPCDMTDQQYVDYGRWRERYEKGKAGKPVSPRR